jgi:hypothetical protein
MEQGMGHREHDGLTDLRKAGTRRLNDAEALLGDGEVHERGAAYLAGYAVECKLKCVAMGELSCWNLKDLARRWKVDDRVVYTHGLECLVRRLASYRRFRESTVWMLFVTQVSKWRPSWRYSPDVVDLDAHEFVKAVKGVVKWFEVNG